MQINVTFRHVEPTPALKAHAEEKLERMVKKHLRRPVDAHVILSTPRFPESVFRGRIASGPFWHVDVWQAALDEVRHRGREQSDYLLSRVQELNPHG